MAMKNVSILDTTYDGASTPPTRTGRINADHVLFAHALETRGSEAIMRVAIKLGDAGKPIYLTCAGQPSDLD